MASRDDPVNESGIDAVPKKRTAQAVQKSIRFQIRRQPRGISGAAANSETAATATDAATIIWAATENVPAIAAHADAATANASPTARARVTMPPAIADARVVAEGHAAVEAVHLLDKAGQLGERLGHARDRRGRCRCGVCRFEASERERCHEGS